MPLREAPQCRDRQASGCARLWWISCSWCSQSDSRYWTGSLSTSHSRARRAQGRSFVSTATGAIRCKEGRTILGGTQGPRVLGYWELLQEFGQTWVIEGRAVNYAHWSLGFEHP